MTVRSSAALALVLALCATSCALAQAYPSRRVRIVVPFSAGSQTEVAESARVPTL